MDIMNGFDFDFAADRKKAWDSIFVMSPNAALDRHLAPSFPDCKSLTNTCIIMAQLGWQSFKRALHRLEDMSDVALTFTSINENLGYLFVHAHPWLATSWFLPHI